MSRQAGTGYDETYRAVGGVASDDLGVGGGSGVVTGSSGASNERGGSDKGRVHHFDGLVL